MNDKQKSLSMIRLYKMASAYLTRGKVDRFKWDKKAGEIEIRANVVSDFLKYVFQNKNKS